MRNILCCSAFVLLLVIPAYISLPARDKEAITQEYLEVIIQNLDWVIQGQVTNVEAKFIGREALIPGHIERNIGNTIITEVTLKIEKMIAGEYDGNEIKFILNEGELGGAIRCPAGFSLMKVKVGDRAIVGLVPNSRGTGYNILDNDMTFFKLDGTNLVPYREEYYLAVDKPLEVIAKKAKEREMPEIFKAADLVCTGTVTKLIDPDKLSRRIVVSIDESLKGTAGKSEITVDVSDLYEPFSLQKPGYRVILFLKKNDSGYKPVAGTNGYCVMEGDKLRRGHGLPLRMSVSQLKCNIKKWKEVGQ